MGGYGGAIYNYGGKISKIIGNFENNYAQNVSGVSSAVGGAIYNRGNAEITNGIEGNFIGNYTYSAGGSAYGGAIYNNSYSTIGDIIGDFINNYAYATGNYARGGAIFNVSNSSIGAITGNFTNNYAYSSGTDASGGAINNNTYSSIGVITGNFINNYAYSTGTYANGGALANVNKIKGVFGNFIGNYAKATGTNAIGGAIANRYGNASSYGQIEQISGTFSGNYAQTTGTTYAWGGAICNQANTVIGEIINSNFYNNYAKATNGAAQGGAIYNGAGATITSITDSTFTGNYVEGAGATTDGGAIWNAGTLTLNGTNTFTNNNVNNALNDIYNSGTINLGANSTTNINGGWNGTNAGLAVMAAGSVLNANAPVTNGLYTMDNATINLGSYTYDEAITHNGTTLVPAGTTVYGRLALTGLTVADSAASTLNTANSNIEANTLGALTLSGNLNYAIDVDTVNQVADTISVSSMEDTTSTINLDTINWMGAGTALGERKIALMGSANSNLANAIALGVANYTNGNRIYSISKLVENDIAYLNFGYGNLYTAVHDTGATRNYTMSVDEPALASALTKYGAMEGPTTGTNLGTLNIEGNGFGVIGNNKGGITVAEGQTLNIQNVGAYTTDQETGAVTITNNGWNGFNGTVINNSGTLNVSDSVFANNHLRYNGPIGNWGGTINSISDTKFYENYVSGERALGVAIHNTGSINSISGEFIRNYAIVEEDTYGGALYNEFGHIGTVNATFTDNYIYGHEASSYNLITSAGGAVFNYNKGVIDRISGDFTRNYAFGNFEISPLGFPTVAGGAIGNTNIMTIVDSSFYDNATSGVGGAIANAALDGNNIGLLNIYALDKNVLFSGNKSGVTPILTDGKVTGVTGGVANDVFNAGTLNLNAADGKSITFSGSITDYSTPVGTININAEENQTGTINFNSTVTQNNINTYSGTVNTNAAVNANSSAVISGGLFNANAKITTPSLALSGGTLHAGINDAFAVTNFNGTGGNLNFVTGAIESQTLGSVSLSNTVALAIDVALNGSSATNRGDRVLATSVVDGSTGMIDLNSVTVVADTDNRYTKVYYTNGALKDNASSQITSLTGADGTTIYSVSSGSDSDGAYLMFKNSDILNLVIASRDYEGNVSDATTPTYRLSSDESISADIAEIGLTSNTTSIGKLAYGINGDAAVAENANFTIDGAGYGVNGNGKGGITVGEGQTLNIQNVGAYTTDQETGEVTITNNGWNGFNGTVINNSGTLNVKDSVFNGNTANNSDGGVLYSSGTASITDSMFANNSANNGGAISSYAGVSIGDNNIFQNNTARYNGGAIYASSVTVDDGAIFENNSAYNGGAIYASFVEIGKNAQFLNNKVTGNAPGGAIFANSKVTVGDNAKFENNSGMFGAIYAGNDVTIGSGAQFVNNIGTGSGPGAAIHASGKITTGANSKFENNYSNLFAGAIYANSVDIGANSVFKNNYGAVSSWAGGAINIYGGNTYTSTITDTDFIDNANAGDGGAIGITGASTVNLIAQDKDVVFSGNKSKATITRNAETGEVTVEGGVANDIYNQGTLNLKAGQGKSITFGGSITDANSPIGTITVGDTSGTYAGDINFNDSVTQKDMTITSGTANIGASDLKITNGVLNNAHLNLYDGELTTAVRGTGTTHIDANDKVIVNTTITNNTLSLDKGTAKIAHKDLLTLAGTIGNGGALDIANNEIENLNLANVTLNGEDIKLSIDTNFETRVADVISGVVISNEGGNHIVIQNINAISDTVLGATVPYGIKVAEQNIKDNVILANDFYVNSENLRNNYFITYGDSDDGTYGQLEIAFANLKTAVNNGSTQKVYTMVEDETVTSDLGNLGGTTLSVNAGNNKITGQGTTGGINVSDGQTLTLNDVSEYSGFDTVVTNNEGGTVNINNSTVKDNSTGVDNKSGATVNITDSIFNNTTTDVNNAGTMNLNGDNTFEKKVTGSGDTNVQTGKTVVGENAEFSQGDLTVSEDAQLENNNKVTVNGSLTNNGTITNTDESELNISGNTSSNSVNNGTIDNDGVITVNSKFTNNGEISGDGSLENKSNFTNAQDGTIEQKTVTNNGATLNNAGTITAETISNTNGGVINSNASNLTGAISNTATLNLTGGTNNNTITGSNGTTNFAGETVNNAEITQATVTNSGSLDNNSTITAAINNSGSLDNTDGKLVGAITNNENASITSSASNLVGAVDNDGTLVLNGGTIQDTISGDGTTQINSGAVTLDNKEITGNDIELKDGATLAIRNNGDISEANSLIAKGGTVDLLDNATKTTDLGNIDLSNGNLNVAIDADLAAVKGDVITGQVTEEGGSILLSEVRILTDSTSTIPLEILVADTGVRNYVDLADNARTSSSQTTSYLLTYTKSTGELTFEYSNLENAVKSETPTKVYNVGESGETVNNDLGELKGDSLVVNGNNKNITGQGTTEGITVSDGQRLAINDVDNYSGFDTAITNNEGGTLDITNTDFNNNKTADIDNDGTLNLYGTDSFDKVTGEGTSNIKADSQGNGADVTVNNNGKFEQEEINIDDKSALHNNGTVTADNINNNGTLDNNKTVNSDITNSGTVDNSGTINGDIDNNENSQMANTGKINGDVKNDGTITNTGSIKGDITNSEKGDITSKADGIDGNIANDGELNLTGGANNNTITGNGTTNFSGTGSNNSTITQQSVTNSGTLTNNGNINAPVDNTGKLTNSASGTITDITNAENGEFNNKGRVTGDTVNNGTLNNKGLISGDLTNNQNGKINNNGKINSENISNDGTIITATQDLLSPNAVNNNGTITYNSGSQTHVDVTGNGKINLNTNSGLLINNSITGNQINLNNSIISFGNNGDISNARSLNVNGGGINVEDNKVSSTNLGNVNLNKNSKLMIDFNVSNETSDKLIANINNNGGKFVVTSINIKGTTLKDRIRVHLGDTTTLGRKNTTSTTFKLPDIVTPIRRLHGSVSGGWLNYSGGGSGYSDFNPSVMASSVATQVGGVITQNETLHQGFYHMNRYSKYPYTQRFAAENPNTYAINESAPVYTSKSELPLTSEAMWTTPYTTFEKVRLRGGVGVSNVAYGALYGGDSKLKDLGNGKKGVVSAFVGYNGNHMSYDGISMNQQGGLLGVTGTLYKGNFFTGLTMSAGASAGEAYTNFGTDNFAMMTAGIANKTGYNWELKDGKIIIQPTMFIGYTFANTFDYRNSAGARIDSDPVHAIQIAPSLKIIGNTKTGWQPYAGVDMVWNVQTGGKVMAEDTRLPQLSVKPYVQYGVGLQKSWGDRFTAHAQTMLRNGGRTGIVLSVGFRWTLGKKQDTKTQVRANTVNKTVSQPKQVIKKLYNTVPDYTTKTSTSAKIENI